jgi:hypothetical protein
LDGLERFPQFKGLRRGSLNFRLHFGQPPGCRLGDGHATGTQDPENLVMVGQGNQSKCPR